VIIRGEGTMVAIVDAQQTVHLQPVRLGRDLGSSIEVVAGLPENTAIVLNPSDTLKEGTQVLSQVIQQEIKTPELARK
jgi:hypothetical protein